VLNALSQQIPEELPATARLLIGHLRQEPLPGLIGQRVRCTEWGHKQIEGSIETPSVRRSTRGRRSGLKVKIKHIIVPYLEKYTGKWSGMLYLL
jgi:hypothetical protein